jgi:hypothetical protein
MASTVQVVCSYEQFRLGHFPATVVWALQNKFSSRVT